VITAVFYAVVRNAPAAGVAREQHYGLGYALALAVSVLLTVAAVALAVGERRGAARARPAVET
jgi:hypothetical protein